MAAHTRSGRARRGGAGGRWPAVRFGAALALILLHPAMASAAPAYDLPAYEPSAYHPIAPRLVARTVTLTGQDLGVDDLVAIARGGARVVLGPAAATRARESYGLLLEAAAEDVPVYLFNRGGGLNREVVTFTGDPLAPATQAKIAQTQLRAFRNGVRAGAGAELTEEAEVRAMMAVRANTIVGDAPSPQLMAMLIALLNARITPVVRSAAGTVGEADLALMGNVAATMVGRGEAYLGGVRMPAAEALAKAGLTPLAPFAADYAALTSTNAYTASQAALLVADARTALQWADLTYGLDLLGMNSSITPLALPTQRNRPEPWLNWHARRMLALLRGSYLFETDATRIIQDADSLRASSIRQGSAWEAWAELERAAVMQMNSSDHNPGTLVGLNPGDSWELATPQMMRYHVKGGRYSGGKSGYVTSNANWDPYPLANRVEAFSIALANMDVAVVQRIYRFGYAFHTGIRPADVLSPEQLAQAAPQANGTTIAGYWAAIEAALPPVPPLGIASDEQGNGDLESQAPLKVAKARAMVATTDQLLAHELLTATYWLDIRHSQDPKRRFGTAPTALWTAFRKLMPWQLPAADRPERPPQDLAEAFMAANPPAMFLPAGPLPTIGAPR